MADFNTTFQAHFGRFTDTELQQIRSYFKEEQLAKGDFFTNAEQVCQRLSLVTSGILRVYAWANDREITQWIATENFFLTDVQGFFFDQPNRWNIQALTPVTLWSIHKKDYMDLCTAFPQWHDIEKGFIVKCFAMIENRVFSHLSMTAEERYTLYFNQNPALFNQVPLHYIASVLGMTAETFSRIRKRQLAKS